MRLASSWLDRCGATPQYGPGMPHCYTGGPAEYTMQQNNANWTQRKLPALVDHTLAPAPDGADTKSWRYSPPYVR